jgi:uncharacterized glyoxalase superfamily protein PhnB
MAREERPWRVAPILGVDDVVTAVGYFVDELGFTRPSRIWGSEEEKVYAVLRRRNIEVHVQIRRQDEEIARGEHDGDADFFVDDVKALRNEFRRKNVTIRRDLEDEPYGLLDFTVETPWGHRITFGSEVDD